MCEEFICLFLSYSTNSQMREWRRGIGDVIREADSEERGSGGSCVRKEDEEIRKKGPRYLPNRKRTFMIVTLNIINKRA